MQCRRKLLFFHRFLCWKKRAVLRALGCLLACLHLRHNKTHNQEESKLCKILPSYCSLFILFPKGLVAKSYCGPELRCCSCAAACLPREMVPYFDKKKTNHSEIYSINSINTTILPNVIVFPSGEVYRQVGIRASVIYQVCLIHKYVGSS